MPKFVLHFFFFAFLMGTAGLCAAQPGWTFDLLGSNKKPEEYEEKKLPSEKTGEKKFKLPRRIIQNTVSHYNYHFNANNKLKLVIERAKMGQKDDYAKLLSFYPYSLDNTAAQKTELDSVIYKSTAGILLHDLRTDWVDNFYFLIGKAYFLRKDFDSAAMTFQFINYNLFPRKNKNDDESKVIGTNSEPGTGLSIADKEKRNLLQKTFTIPPSRNDALVWLIRTFTEQQEYGDAAGMINILQNDRNLPKRLQNDLAEVTANWFFAQKRYDSASVYLEKALSNAEEKQDKSRWEFLLAQMLEMQHQYDKAKSYYAAAAKHTNDPVMDIYAQLNSAKMMRDNTDFKQLENSIANLLRMARKDKYENYRDILYNSAGQLSMQKPDTLNAILLFDKSTQYKTENVVYRNRSFLSLGNIAYAQHRYRDAARFYDSLQLDDPELELIAQDINEKKAVLGRLVVHYEAFEKEDSLQRIAALAPAEREAFVKRLSKTLRKEKGGPGNNNADDGFAPINFSNNNTPPPDLFQSSSKGDWYFNSNAAKGKGFNEFKQKWGKRENVDNWRRKAAITAAIQQQAAMQTNANPDDAAKGDADTKTGEQSGNTPLDDMSFEGMMANLPLTNEKLDSSNAKAASNLLAVARIFQNELFDYVQAIQAYTTYIDRFKNTSEEADVYLGLYYCYTKLGDEGKAAYYKNILSTKFANSKQSTMVNNPAALDPNRKDPAATATYEQIYNLYLEGKFAEAAAMKKSADSVYGTNYWTPQLLYIGALHYVRDRNDSAALAELRNLQALYPASPLAAKAATLMDVLGRRAQIEDYLNKLEITRAEEEAVIVGGDAVVPVQTAAPKQTTTGTVPKKIEQPAVKTVVRDSVVKTLPQFVNGSFTLKPANPHFVMMVLDKVDNVYINESKNALTRFNKSNYQLQGINISRDAIDADKAILLFSPFENAEQALVYYDKIKKAAPGEISWLPPNKFSFYIIDDANLQILKTNKDLNSYKTLLNSNFGNRF